MPLMLDAAAKRNLRIAIVPLLMTLFTALACSGSGEQPTSTAPAPTATMTPTSTPIPTPTPTPIPPPQGVWSQYWTNNEVKDIEQDGDGYLWARGSGSIVRWDLGESTYQEFGISEGLPANIAQDIFIGPQGKVWLSFYEHGFWRFDDPDWTLIVELSAVEGARLDAHAVGPDGVLWICTDEGLSKYDGEQWAAYQMTGGMDQGFCEYLTVDNQGNPWMQGTYGISVFHEPDDWVLYDSIVSASGRQMNFFRPIGAYTAPNGSVWFAYWGDHVIWYDGQDWHTAYMRPGTFALSSTGQPWVVKNGFLALDRTDDITTYAYGTYLKVDIGGDADPVWVTEYYWPRPFYNRMPVDRLGEIYPGFNGDMWITSPDGLVHIRGSSISLIPVEGWRDLSEFQDLEVTRNGDIYLALGDGISRLYGAQTIPLHAQDDLNGNFIYELDVAPDGTMWVYSNGGLQSFDGGSWTRHIAPSFAADMKITPNGEVWLAHRHFGISRWDGNIWEQFEPGSVPGSLDGSVDALDVGVDGVVWMGISEVGVSSYDGSQWTAYPFDDGMMVEAIGDMVVDGEGDVYLIGRDSNNDYIYLHRLSGGVWTTERMQESSEMLAMGPDGSVWIGQRRGGVFNIREENWESTDLTSGLAIKAIYDLQFGPDGSMWLGTDNGAWRFDGHEWQNYTTVDGLISDYVQMIAVGPDNTILFGGNGLARFGTP